MLRLNSKIDRAMSEWFARLGTLTVCEQQAIRAAIKCGIRHGNIAEIPDALLSVDPVLAALWGQWNELLSVEAWAAVLKTVFLKSEVTE
jgi:hypothetical protein